MGNYIQKIIKSIITIPYISNIFKLNKKCINNITNDDPFIETWGQFLEIEELNKIY